MLLLASTAADPSSSLKVVPAALWLWPNSAPDGAHLLGFASAGPARTAASQRISPSRDTAAPGVTLQRGQTSQRTRRAERSQVSAELRSWAALCTRQASTLRGCAARAGSTVLLWSLLLLGLVVVVPRALQFGLVGLERSIVTTMLSFEQVLSGALLSAVKMVRACLCGPVCMSTC